MHVSEELHRTHGMCKESFKFAKMQKENRMKTLSNIQTYSVDKAFTII